MRRRALVYGATGQIGRELTDLGPLRGWDVIALSRAQADLADPDAAAGVVSRAGPLDAVINAAAYTAVDRAETDPATAQLVNAEAPGRIAEAAARAGLPFIHFSTDYVFPGDGAAPYREDDPTGPRNVYGRTKLEGEIAVREACDHHIVFRTSWVYSPHGHNFVTTMLRLGARQDEVRVIDDQIGAPTSATDIAEAVFTVLDASRAGREQFGVFHLAGGGEASWADVADAIMDFASPVWARRPAIRRIATKDYPAPAARPANSRLDCAKLAAAYGYRAPDWRESLARVMRRLGHG